MKKFFKNRKNKIKRMHFKVLNLNNFVIFSKVNTIFFKRNKYFLFKKFYKKLAKKKFVRAYVFLRVNFRMFKKSKNSRMGKGKGNFYRWNIVLTKNNKVIFLKKVSLWKFYKRKSIT